MARKTERLFNLTVVLLTAGRFLSKEQIRAAVAGYDQTSDEAFDRQFERDKDELRALGIPIQTGNNEAFFDDEHGYRIDRVEFEAPEIRFSSEERAILKVAATTWQHNLLSASTGSALRKLGGANSGLDAERLASLLPRIDARETAFEPLWAAVANRQVVHFRYRGTERQVEPWKMLNRAGAWYLIGHDRGRGGARVFKLARFEDVPRRIGAAEAFRTPETENIDTLISQLDFGSPEKMALVAILDNGAPELRLRGQPVDYPAELPDGYRLYRMPYAFDGGLVADICASGREALLIEPVSLRDEVISRLRTLAGGSR